MKRLSAVKAEHHGESRPAPPSLPALWLQALRAHQWSKNVLVFVPLLMAHKFTDLPLLLKAIAAFVAFSFTASAAYILNDLLDIQSDRMHPVKRHRPFASGALTARWGLVLAGLAITVGGIAGGLVSAEFLAVLAGYLGLTTFYSTYLKRVPVADVLLLCCLYAWRMFGGGVACDVPLSHWLLVFSLFLFLSLALVKRTSELSLLKSRGQIKLKGREYRSGDMEMLRSFGAASGYLSVLVYALYVNAESVRALYGRPGFLALNVPLLLFWISRTWLITHRGEMHSDPIVFALKDRASYALGAAILAVFLMAK